MVRSLFVSCWLPDRGGYSLRQVRNFAPRPDVRRIVAFSPDQSAFPSMLPPCSFLQLSFDFGIQDESSEQKGGVHHVSQDHHCGAAGR